MKKSGGRKKIKSTKFTKSSKNIFFDNERLLAISIAAFFIFAFFLTAVPKASITGDVVVTGKQIGEHEETNFIQDMFSGWEEGNLDISLAKVLFWVTLLLFIFGVLSFAKFPENGFLQFLLALIISFLATAYITPDEIYTVLISYTALGLTLASIIPFMILIFTSAMLVSAEKIKKMSLGKLMLQVVLWFLWVGFLLYRLIKMWAEETFVFLLKGGGIVFLVVFAASVVILIFNKHFRKWWRSLGLEIRRAKEEAIGASEAAERKAKRKTYEES